MRIHFLKNLPCSAQWLHIDLEHLESTCICDVVILLIRMYYMQLAKHALRSQSYSFLNLTVYLTKFYRILKRMLSSKGVKQLHLCLLHVGIFVSLG